METLSSTSKDRLSSRGSHFCMPTNTCEEWQHNSDRNSDLRRALESLKVSGNLTDIDITHCTWDDMLEQMAKARDVYFAKGTKSKVRAVLRQGTDIANAISPVISLMPQQYGLQVIQVGLAMIFKVGRSARVNQNMTDGS
ncbi:hypothetical protein P280DRAFT_21778 [Massarina eburnea CBS 473.64]|uniref:Uncharacterized protein n=1 Tax=Massarina eburnea CBS 473.64 TaxID=1395130 RepID=A0A6A6SL86_9PLEO|nr:hypothetical protein P280DRAFT_21778 [Massarina eburnea CBS 473.64]